MPIEKIIASATIAETRFTGRYLINRLGPVSCGKINLSTEAILQKYSRLLKDSGDRNLPEATGEIVQWITNEGSKQVHLVSFGNGQTNGVCGLQFAFQVVSSKSGSAVIPLVLFDWRSCKSDTTFEEENKKASTAFAGIGNKAIANTYLAAVDTAAKQALRRVVTENLQEIPK